MFHFFQSKYQLLIASVLICFLSLLWLIRALFLGLYPDFNVYYAFSLLYVHSINYYAHPFLGILNSYPPFVFLLFSPFTIFTIQVAEVIWAILNFIFLLVSLFYLSKIFAIRFFSSTNFMLMTFVFVSFPTKFTIGMGQINLFILVLIVISLWYLKRRKKYLSGAFLGVALSIKFSPIWLPFYFLMKFDRKVMLGILASIAFVVVLVLLLVPSETYLYYIFKILPQVSVSSWKLDYYNQSISGVIGRSIGVGYLAGIIKTTISTTFIIGTFIILYKNQQKDFLVTMLKIGVLITLSLLFNAFSWQHHFVWMIVPFYATIFYIKSNNKISKLRKNIFYVIVLFAYILVAINFKDPSILPNILRSHVFYGALTLFFLDMKLLLDK